MVVMPLYAQTDSRNRTVETVVQDGLAQLPTKTPKAYRQLMGELAATGQKGMAMLCAGLVPASEGKNATFEYAIDGVVSYVSEAKNSALRQSVCQGLKDGIEKCQDKVNRAFLLSQLQKIATTDDAPVFIQYLNDEYLKTFAVNGLAVVAGTDGAIKNLINSQSGDKQSLAYLAYVKKLQGVEETLLGWTQGADDKTLAAVYNALTVCGGEKSLAALEQAAAAKQYNDEPTGATDCLLQLLATGKYKNEALKVAKVLTKDKRPALRSAGLKLLLENDKKNAAKNILSALKDPCAQYRNTALDFAEATTDKSIYPLVAGKAAKLNGPAATDVVRWLGNHHRKEQIDMVTHLMNAQNGKDSVLTRAAIEAAGKIGGEKALAALMNNLKGGYAKDASKALLSFNGDISNSVLEGLKSSDANIQQQSLNLASVRRLHAAYGQVLNLTKSENSATKAAAYKALNGVATSENFNDLCNLMEKTQGAEAKSLQAAAKSSIANETGDKQYSMVSGRMASASKPSLYYPLLAQAGTHSAIQKLQQEYEKAGDKSEAFNSLLQVDNSEMIEVLYNLASVNAADKDKILNRYRTLVKKSSNNPIQKYLLYRRALELNPGEKVTNELVSALSESRTLPALSLAAKYMENKKAKEKAANTVKAILSKQPELQSGNDAKKMIEKARDIFKAQTDADAGYAVDELNGMLAKSDQKEGFVEVMRGAEGTRIQTAKEYENFEMFVDWKYAGTNATLYVRNQPVIKIGKEVDVVQLSKTSSQVKVNENGWNNLYVKVLNDRLEVKNNGETVVTNFVISNGDEPVADRGVVEIISESGKISVRNVNVKELPSTPIYTLTEEEQKEGFELLFDGRSLDKWQGNTTDYVPLDGNIYVSAKYGGTGNLYTKKKYSDFVYRFEFCFVEPGVNNGIGIRTNIGTDAAYDGMEIQVLDHDDPIYKGLQPYQQHGAVYGIIVPKHVKFGKLGTWNTEEIRIVGDDIKVTVNGDVILEGNIREACQGHNVAPNGEKKNPYTVDHKNHPGLFNPEGYVSFCGHGAGVKFRNVRILDLSKSKNTAKKKVLKKK